jgi:hypothetical protein
VIVGLTSRFNGELFFRPPPLPPASTAAIDLMWWFICQPAEPRGQRTLRVPLLRFLLPLTVLVAAPLLGVGSRAHAGYVTLVSLVSCPHAGFFTDGAALADPDDVATLGISNDSGEPPADDARFLLPSELPSESLNFGLSSTGAGSQTPPDGPGAGGPNQLPCVASQPPADPPLLVGFLFLDRVSNQPPPFPSRLFRPPRLS